MALSRRWLALLLVWALIPIRPLSAQTGTVEDVLVTGLNRMTREAFLHAFGVRPGEPYDKKAVLRGYRNLWDLGLFEDLVVETETGPKGGTVLVVKLVERPVLSSVDFEENKVLTRTAIEDRLKERKASLDLGKPLNLKNVAAAEQIIRDMLGEKGFLSAEVSHKIDEITKTSRGVRFSIRPGGKTRIDEIDFVGNTVFSDRHLRSELKLNSARHWYMPWSSKSLYHPLKWDQDANKIRELYQNEGYLDVEVRAPVVEVEKEKVKGKVPSAEEGKEGAAPWPPPLAEPPESEAEAAAREEAAAAGQPTGTKEEQRAAKEAEKARKKAEKEERKNAPRVSRLVTLTVPIVEGKQYRLGEIKTQGNTVLNDAQILAVVPLHGGDILREGVLKGATEAISRAYNDRGYLYATAVRQIHRRPEGEPVADVTIEINEDKPYYVGRINFAGNTSTQDKVLRREMVLNEGELFSKSKLDLSKYKINQLGYFEVKDEPVIQPVEGENRVNIVMSGEEKGRNEIQVGGGYSGTDGAFFTGTYSTRNFLGRGQILSTYIQLGGSANRYQLQFVEPWFLNRPLTAGFSLFRRDVDYGNNLRSSGRGGGIVLGKPVSRFGRVNLSYNYETVTSSNTVGGLEATNRISSVTPQYQVNKLDDFYRPRRGWLASAEGMVAGGFLGGDTAFLKPMFTYTGFRHAWGRSLFAFHGQMGMIRTWGEGSLDSSANVYDVPRVQRFWLGGDTFGPRVFETRSITPKRYVKLNDFGIFEEAVADPTGRLVSDFDRNGDGILNERDLVELGGDRFLLLQGEYVLPFKGPAEIAAFVDVGNALFEDQSWGFDGTRVSAGVEMRFYLPVFPVPLRLIFGWPLRQYPGDRTGNFTFSIGKSF
ncbi:MAG TPA: outer membrane protein assembly factor BamA [Candidatus Polarisedimenticolaceae bacterium]|nr:outer membrane protein assembly factor BamA [Candidatus Polarisedimenticolaceae bacterium]